jgi:RimJ/RimL family protein N-acetyltransferase
LTEKEKEEQNVVFPFIKGERIDLVPQNSKWIPLYSKWHNDPNVRHFARHDMPRTPEEFKRWFEPPSGRGVREGVFFTIYHKKDQCPIGSIGIHRINWVNRNGFIGGLIGEPDYWGIGIVGEAAKLLINYGFTELNLHKISANILNVNKRSLRAAEKLGFKQEGILREHMYVDGMYADFHQFGLLKRDWIAQNKKIE